MPTRKEILKPWEAEGHTTSVRYFYPDTIPAEAIDELKDYHPTADPKFELYTELENPNDENTSLIVKVGDAWGDKARDVMQSLRLIPAAHESGRHILMAKPGHLGGGGVWWELYYVRLQKTPQGVKEKIDSETGVTSIGNELILSWRPKPEKRGEGAGKIPDEYYLTCWKW